MKSPSFCTCIENKATPIKCDMIAENAILQLLSEERIFPTFYVELKCRSLFSLLRKTLNAKNIFIYLDCKKLCSLLLKVPLPFFCNFIVLEQRDMLL